MLNSVGVKFISIVHVYREVQEIKGYSGLQIYSKQQMSSSCILVVFLLCFQTQFAVKRVKRCSFYVLTTKTTQTSPQVFSVNGSIICQFCCTKCTSSVQYHRFNIAKFFQIWSTMAGYDELSVGFSQSETAKYFE